MDVLSQIAGYLVQTFLGLFMLAMLLRFLLQVAKADFYNPISQFLVKVTNPLVIPARKVIPSLGGFDLATLLLSLVIQMLSIVAILAIKSAGFPSVLQLLLWSGLGIMGLLVNIYFFSILALIILSWVAPGSKSPAIFLLFQITEPVMAPIRKLLPPMGGMDFSPILVFIALNVLEYVLEGMAMSVGLSHGLRQLFAMGF